METPRTRTSVNRINLVSNVERKAIGNVIAKREALRTAMEAISKLVGASLLEPEVRKIERHQETKSTIALSTRVFRAELVALGRVRH